MANIEEAIRRLKYLYEVHGADQVARAQAAITASTTETERASLSLEKSFNSLERRYVPVVRAQQEYQRAQNLANDALKQNPALQDRANVILQNARQQYEQAAHGAQAYGTALNKGTGEARLARHELINLSRQIQDVGVSLASGQAPLTVLIQQGSQIADVFASSSGTLKGFFTQAGTWALRFIGSTAGMITAAVGLGTAFIASAVSFASAQREIERALAATGRASGVTRDQINEIAKASASAFGISTKEAQEAATAFAATGRIQAENVAMATKLIDQYAKAGENAEEKTKELGKALLDPAKGFLEMSKSLDFLSAAQLANIQRMQAAGDMAGAQRAGMEALNIKLQEMEKHTGKAAKGWNLLGNAISEWWRTSGSVGVAGGGFDTTGLQKQLADAQRVLEMRQKMFGPVGAAQDAARVEVERLTKAIADQNKAAEQAGLDKLVLQANAVAAAVLPATAQIRAMEEALNKLRDARIATGGPVTGAETVLNVALQQEKEKEASLIRQAEYVQQLQARYVGVSIESSKQLDALQRQLPVIQARTGHEKIVAQEIARAAELMAKEVPPAEALRIAAAERKNDEAAVAAAIGQQIKGLDQQYELMKATSAEEKARVKAAQAYQKAFDDTKDSMKASEVASKVLRNETEQAAQSAEKIEESFNNTNIVAVNAAADDYNRRLQQALQTAQAIENEWQNIFGVIVDITDNLDVISKGFPQFETWVNDAGQRVQFNPKPEGGLRISGQWGAYLNAEHMKKIYGSGNFEETTSNIDGITTTLVTPNENFWKQTTDEQAAAWLAYNETMEELNDTTAALNDTMRNALSPYYSMDPRTTRLGFRAGAVANPDWMTGATNQNPVVAVTGFASGGSFVVGGGYSPTDNKIVSFPAASGEEVVVNRTPGRGGGQSVTIDNRVIIQGNVDEASIDRLKRTQYQQAQRMRSMLAA